MLSTLDMSILEILYGDARTTAEDIATMTGHALDEIRQSIARLEREKICLLYTSCGASCDETRAYPRKRRSSRRQPQAV